MTHPECSTQVSSVFLDDVLRGLGQRPKALLAKYFYDRRGSELFDEICALEEYYPYRVELSMLPEVCRYLSQQVEGDLEIVEFGAGSLAKIRVVLDSESRVRRYLPIDIASDFLRSAAGCLADEFSGLEVAPVVADFTRSVALPAALFRRVGFFPGSTIGNFEPHEAQSLLARIRQNLGDNALLLIGVDTKKDSDLLNRAYNDSRGVTAEFNRNILVRINRELMADFDVQCFHHQAFYNADRSRIEMHLVSDREQYISVNGSTFRFARGETIHTENSYKYTSQEFLELASRVGWVGRKIWFGSGGLFAVYLLEYP